MPTLLESIRARQEGGSTKAEPYVLEIDAGEWAAWLAAPVEAGMADGLCPWVQHGPDGSRQWRHRVSGQIYTWGELFRLPGDTQVYGGFEVHEKPRAQTKVRRTIPI